MCKGKGFRMCTELGDDPKAWSEHALLNPPQWFRDQLLVFSNSVRAAANGNIDSAIELLREVRSDDLRHWYVEHGCRSGKFRWWIRKRLLGPERSEQDEPKPNRNLVQPNAKLQAEVLRRDRYCCRYCGIGLISKAVLLDFGDIVSEKGFSATTDAERHGSLVAFRANFDHVVPASLEGETDVNNLVSCCWSCNYGKRGLTLHQVGLADPRLRQPSGYPDWDGLTDIAPILARAASRIRRARR